MTERPRYAVEIDGVQHEVERSAIPVADVLRLAARQGPAMVVRTDGGRAALVPPDHEIALDSGRCPRLRTFSSDDVRWLRVDGVTWDWPADAIREDDVRAIAGIPAGHGLVSEDAGTPVPRGSLLDLTGRWPLRLRSEEAAAGAADPARAAEPVSIVVNGRPTRLALREVTFEDLVSLAFPGVDPFSTGCRSLTVTYRRGPADRPEGSLISRENVRVLQGEIFSVTATDKS